MTTRLTRIQLIAFMLVTVLAVGYGTINYFNLGALISPPYEVRAQFETAGGIYQRADVDLLGTKVGTVRRIEPGPGSATTVVLALDKDVKIPRDVRATIGNKSAIGEQYVELAPQSAGGPSLRDGDVIELSRTTSPIDVAVLLKDLDALAGSIPTDDLATVMKELSTGLDGVGGTLGHLIDNSDRLSKASLDNVEDLTALIDDAVTVLDTQVDRGPQTVAYLRELAGLTSELHRIDASFAELFGKGVLAGVEVSNVLADNQAALPVLLNQLVSVTTVATERTDAMRKFLVLFPYALEVGATGVRRCGSYDAKTGKPVESTCRYDAQGRPFYSAYLGMQLPQFPGTPPYFPCTKGYEGTTKYQPNGRPLSGTGPSQKVDSPVNMEAGCTAPLTDPNTPNVRGSKSIIGDASDAGRVAPRWAEVTPYAGVPEGRDGLAWLLNNLMEDDD
jgi:phospholipid/cholesterol/gamma-HCH transport system substrate-binding protein